MRGGVYATSISVTNFRVASPRLSTLFPFLFFFFFLLPLRRICLGLISTSRRTVTICLREGWRTLGHKFPSCSKQSRIDPFSFFVEKDELRVCIYICMRMICIFRKNDLLLIAITYYDALHVRRKDTTLQEWTKFVS